MSEIMIDLETMSTAPDAAIVSIGAVLMDPLEGLGATFYRVVDLQSALNLGGQVDASTILWWLQQGHDARAELQDPGAVHIGSMLVDLRAWMDAAGDIESRKVWGNGANFDLPILASAAKRGCYPAMWHHWNSRCYRTLKAENRHIPAGERIGTHHNALDDAMHQARHWVAIKRATQVSEVATAPIHAAVVVDDGSEGGDPA